MYEYYIISKQESVNVVVRSLCSWSKTRDLYINILDAVAPIHVLSNHVATDKLTTANRGTFTSSSASLSSQAL